MKEYDNIKIYFKQLNQYGANINFFNALENIIKIVLTLLKIKGDFNCSTKRSDHLYIYIKDNGKGMSKKLFKKIFEAGYTTKKRGWGLGLSLSKRIIEDYHSGKIKVLESKINEGTTFEIRLNRFESI